MHFIFIEELKSLSGYTDIRSIRRWLAGMNVRLIKMGKRYCVDQEAFEKALEQKFRPAKQQATYHPKYQTEIEFLTDLESYLSRQ